MPNLVDMNPYETYNIILKQLQSLVELMNENDFEIDEKDYSSVFNPDGYEQMEKLHFEVIDVKSFHNYRVTRRLYFKEHPNEKDLTLIRLKKELDEELNKINKKYSNNFNKESFDWNDDLDFIIDYLYWCEQAYN